MPKKASIGATDSKLKVTFPEGFPQALLVRGVGQALYDKLEELGEPCQGLNGVILLHVEAETERVLGPRFYLRGEPVTIAITPKNIWGEGTKGEICHVERSWNNPFFHFRAQRRAQREPKCVRVSGDRGTPAP